MFRLLPLILLTFVVPLVAQDEGRRLYVGQCGPCHGIDGSGGRGPSLNRPKLVHAPDDDALYSVIRYGIAGTEMPGTWLGSDNVRAIVGYVRQLGNITQPALAGDRVRGREVYFESGCDSCHTIAGRGGAIGPDLDSIGASRSAGHLRESLVSPEVHITSGYAMVRATAADGTNIVGIVVSESTFSVQIRDLSGRVHSFWKEELRAFERPQKRSLMASYTSAEIDDLVAYLASLGGAL
jgi:cytochrome c oxidase cbb3-type subunit 3